MATFSIKIYSSEYSNQTKFSLGVPHGLKSKRMLTWKNYYIRFVTLQFYYVEYVDDVIKVT